jgi:hypothetical protein
MKQTIKSPYTKMYMVTPSVYDKLLHCIDEKQQKFLANLNQKTTNIFNETPAGKFIKNISNDDFIDHDNSGKFNQPKKFPPQNFSNQFPRPDDFPSNNPRSDNDEENIPPGYRDDDFIPPVNEPSYEYEPTSMPVIEDETPMDYHLVQNQPRHIELPIEISTQTSPIPQNINQMTQTNIPSSSQFTQTNIPVSSQFTQTRIPTKSQSVQTKTPKYTERGTSPHTFETSEIEISPPKRSIIDKPIKIPPKKGLMKKIKGAKLKKLTYKQPKAVTFERKKLVITEMEPDENIIRSIKYKRKLPIKNIAKKPIEQEIIPQTPAYIAFEPEDEMLIESSQKPIEYESKKSITYDRKLPITYHPRKRISHNKKEAIEYTTPKKQIIKKLLNQPELLEEISRQPKIPLKVSVPKNIPEIMDETTKKALKYIPKKTKKLDYNPDFKPYPCNECSQRYSTKWSLKRHKSMKHSTTGNISEEKFEDWVEFPQKRTSTYVKSIQPPRKFKRNEEFEQWE